jgi:catechol 2,3-dioxygenase-like lactoylglutathione lyase family enzyme
MAHPIKREIGTVFIPVRDIEAARAWYCDLLGLENLPEILFGHICVIPMIDGSGLVLDSKDFVGPHDHKPVFHLNSDDIPAAFAYMREKGVVLVGEITHGAFFNFRDLDGNLLMVANVPPAPKG